MKKPLNYFLSLSFLLIANLAFSQYTLKGVLLDELTQEPLMFAAVAIKGKDRGTSTDENGKFEFKIREKYYQDTLVFHLLGYEGKDIPISYVLGNPNEMTFYLSSTAFDLVVAEVGASIILNNIFFEFNKHVLLDSSEPELNKIHKYLIKHPDISIEIAGHTDSIGSDAYNLALSEARASAVVAWLEDKGIEQNRMVARGYGETRPLVSNDTEEGQQKNRRVEFVVIKKGEETLENKEKTAEVIPQKNETPPKVPGMLVLNKKDNATKSVSNKTTTQPNKNKAKPVAVYTKNKEMPQPEKVQEVEPSTETLEKEPNTDLEELKKEVPESFNEEVKPKVEIVNKEPEVVVTVDGKTNDTKGTVTTPKEKVVAEKTAASAVSMEDIYKITDFNGVVWAENTDAILINEGVGFSNVTWDVANTSATRFPMGAITEQMTALLVFELVDKEKIALNEPVSTYLPTLETFPDLAVKHLLLHTSGLVDATALEATGLKNIAASELQFKTGTKYSHNALNYHLLALIIEQASGTAYDQLLQDAILNPLGLENTKVWQPQEIDKQRASTYSKENGKLLNQPVKANEMLLGANHLVTTVADAAKWMNAVAKNEVFNTRFQTILPNNSWEKVENGWFTFRNAEGQGVACLTKANGYENFVFHINGKTVVLLSNVENADLPNLAKFVDAVLK